MSVSSFAKNANFGKIEFIDGAGSPATYTSTWTQGGVSISSLAKVRNEPVRIQVRGVHKCTIPGAVKYPQVSFQCFVPNLIDGANNGTGTDLEALLGIGALASRVNTRGASAPWFAQHIKLTFEGNEVGDGTDETITLNHVEIDDITWTEAEDGNVLAFTGTVTGDVVFGNGSSGTANSATFAAHGYAS